MTDLSREAAALLREARSDFEPTPAQLDAARQALFAKVGASAPAAGTPWFAAAGGKIGLTVVAAVLGVGGWLLVRPAAPPTAAKVVEPAAPAARVASERPIATPLLRGAGEAERDEAAPQSRELPPAKAAARSRSVGEAIAPPARSAGETRPGEAAARVRAAEREGPGSDARGPGETVRGRAAARAIASPARMADEPAAEVASGEQVVVPLEAA
ncbi:MAG TPA: hypothetical protein VJR89_18900, partial [Polyangiales bacterium]|nr:hypothetical protein [Polyangiales bacterium]